MDRGGARAWNGAALEHILNLIVVTLLTIYTYATSIFGMLIPNALRFPHAAAGNRLFVMAPSFVTKSVWVDFGPTHLMYHVESLFQSNCWFF